MTTRPDGDPGGKVLTPAGVDALIKGLAGRGYRVLGPTVRDGAIVYDDIDGIADLPAGWTDEQDGGSYRLERRDDDALFGYAVGPHSWKTLPASAAPHACGGAGKPTAASTVDAASPSPDAPFAFIGVALLRAARDRHPGPGLPRRPVRRPALSRAPRRRLHRRGQLRRGRRHLLLRLDGHRPEGRIRLRPRADRAHRDGEHRFLAEVGSDARRRAPRRASRAAPPRPPTAPPPRRSSPTPPPTWAGTLDTDGIHDLLLANLEHPRWDDVAERCLTCGNCTMVCPTCFCTTVEDSQRPHRRSTPSASRRWDSCFTMDFSYIHGGSVRAVGQVALPPVDDPQARHLDRPVRHLGLRRLRPLHHLVPGRHRHHRGGARHPRAPPARRGRHDRGTWTRSSASTRSSPASTRRRSSWSPAAPGTCASRPASISSARASRRTSSILIRHGRVALEMTAPGRDADHLPDRRRGRDRRRLLADPALSLDLRRPRRRARPRHRHRRHVPARQMRGRPRSRLRDDEALRAGPGRAAAGDPAADARCLWHSPLSTAPAAPAAVDPMLPRLRRGRPRPPRGRRHLDARARHPARRRSPSPPGQFNMLYVFGVGEVAISISGDPAEPGRLVHTIRAVGTVSRGADPAEARRRASACADRSAPAGRSRRRSAPTS